MLKLLPEGLFCSAGNFYIDPSRGVENAVITHARRGSQKYYCVTSSEALLRTRIGKNISVQTANYSEVFYINGVKISFHPAGHILGSSQVHMETNKEVYTGLIVKQKPQMTLF